ncbi:MAG: hypothetical protein ABJA10_07395, partial [Aestuariivirga sp.]
MAEYWVPLVITILAVIGSILASYIALPGLDLTELERFSTAPIGSLFATAQNDWNLAFTIAVLVFLCLQVWGYSRGNLAPSPFGRWVVVGAFCVSLIHGFSLATLLSSLNSIRDQLHSGAIIGIMTISIVGGTAVYIFLAKSIEFFGLGIGFWTLAAVSSMRLWVHKLTLLPILLKNGDSDFRHLAVELLVYAVMAAILLSVFRLRQINRAQLTPSLLIPWLVAPIFAQFLLLVCLYLKSPMIVDYVSSNHGYLLNGLILLGVAFLSWIYLKEDRSIAVRLLTVIGFIVVDCAQIGLFHYGLVAAQMNITLLVFCSFAVALVYEKIEILHFEDVRSFTL